ncbi:Pentatricopeptide repeat-containing protein [Camellia lanceoleosa]|uniref:Pentatricopeptide repeat-containing protein n=1 Tax=Camellia lanceoleosa TaxID=1840588 RepID=A0ACC0FHS0_9ERIC|nr:Pentatricopeptide repeat-containing protein [Camellia lanceoleosa]
MINCYSQSKQYIEALAIFNEMKSHGISPDEVTMATVISACAHIGALDLGKEIHLYVMQNEFDLDVYLGSALVDMYAKCGSLDRSLLVFFKLREKNLFCWNSIIEGLAVHGYAEEALAMFSRMEREKIKPNGVTFISVLSACTHAGLVEEGRRNFLNMTHDFSIPPEMQHYGCMVDLLCKAGLIKDALELIQSMRIVPNSVIWGALLSGCRLYKNLEIAQVAVNKLMVLEPNNSGYYTLMVNMYAESNRWNEVAKIRSTMKVQGVEKTSPGSSWIEMDSKIHLFAASDKSHPYLAKIYVVLEMYNNLGAQPVLSGPPPNPQPNPFGNAFVGAGSGLIRGGLGAYGEKILGSSSEYVSGCLGKNHVELLILLFDAMSVLVHGNPLGKDNEESSFCRGEDLWLEKASLPPAFHCFGSVPTFHLAWQH